MGALGIMGETSVQKLYSASNYLLPYCANVIVATLFLTSKVDKYGRCIQGKDALTT